MASDDAVPADHPTPRLDEWTRSTIAPGVVEYAAPSGAFRLHCEATDAGVRVALHAGDGATLVEERMTNAHAAAGLADHLAANAHRYATDWA